MVVVVGGNQRVMTGVGLQGEGFGRSVERDLLCVMNELFHFFTYLLP